MTRLPLGTWLPAAVCALLLMALYGGDLLDFARATTNDVAALNELPNAFFAGGILLFTAGATAVFLLTLWRREPPSHRGYRLLPIVAVLALFVDLFMLTSSGPATSARKTAAAVDALAAASRGPDGQLIVDPEALAAVARRMGTPQYLEAGKRISEYRVLVRRECSGPVTQVGQLTAASGGPPSAGTLLFCLSPDSREAWITAVGLPDDQRFGPRAILTLEGRPHVGHVQAAAPKPAVSADQPGRLKTDDDGG